MPISKGILDSMRGATLVAVLGAGSLVGAAELLTSDPSRPAQPVEAAAEVAEATATPTPVTTRRHTPPVRRFLPAPTPEATRPTRPANWCPPCGMG